MVAQTARELQADHPQIRYHLYSGNAEDVSERLDKGLLDFGMMIRPFDIKKYDSVQLPATDTWGVLMRKDSPLAERDCIRPRDLWDVPLLTSRQRMAQKELMEWLGKKPEELNLVSTYNLIYNASLMVEEGLGYAMTLAGLVNTAGDSVLCFRPLEPTLMVGLDLVWKKYQVFSKATALFLERMQARFPETAG